MSNSDPLEIDKFSTLSEEWWDPNGPCKPLHAINPVRLEFVSNYAPLLHGHKIIDIGCGGGLLTEALAKEGALVTGIDKSESLIAVAKQHAEQNQFNIDYLVDDVENLANDIWTSNIVNSI